LKENHLQRTILPALNNRTTVLSDRYYVSSLAYASLSERTDIFEKISEYFLDPDLTIFLNIPVEVALERIGKRSEQKEIFEKKEYLIQIAHSYRARFKTIPSEKKLVLDGTKSIDEVFHIIKEKVVEKIKE
jgi:dTMP kinase